jgi:soluble lytic murein transglycosylase-like protein
LQAIQRFTNGNITNTNSSRSVFQDILSELVSDDALEGTSQTLGSLLSNVEAGTKSFLQPGGLTSMNINPISTAHANSQSSETATNYDHIILQAAGLYNLPEKLIKSVFKQESNFNPEDTSYAGATGLMQLMPATAKNLGVDDATDPEQNIFGRSKYLSQMKSRYDGDIQVAIAAYNAGPGNVDKYNGIQPFKNYVQKVYSTFSS